MKTCKRRLFNLVGLIVTVGLILALPLSGIVLAEDSVTIAPSKIILNAQGSWEDVQAVIRVPLNPGYQVTEFFAEIYFDNVFIAETNVYFYCYIDDNFIASFDRKELQSVCMDLGISGEFTATVTGEFTACKDASDCYNRTFSGSDLVQVLAPGGMGIRN